jgi:hypothetical protein
MTGPSVAEIVRGSERVAVRPPPSVAMAVTMNVPGVAGVPVRTPSLERVIPDWPVMLPVKRTGCVPAAVAS